jgi:hypothetical protein
LADWLAARARSGGLATRLFFACAHTGAHVATALVLAVALDVGVATCARHAGLGAEGYHSLYKWYVQDFEKTHFPDPAGLRSSLATWTGGLYPGTIKAAMAVFDVPEAVAVGRAALCGAGARGSAPSPLTRPQSAAYHAGMLAYYWLLATPAVGLVFGCYLYLSCNWAGVHHDEAFSALRWAGHKGFTRIRVAPDGDLHIYTVATDDVPTRWLEDPRWRGPGGGGGAAAAARPAHEAAHPSRWAPAAAVLGRRAGRAGAEPVFKVVDLLVVPRSSARVGKGAAAAEPAPPPAKASPARPSSGMGARARAAVAAGPF